MARPLLFEACPELAGDTAWLELGEYPTPVEKLEGVCAAEGLDHLYIKRDDLSSPLYGGNKVRKLEFLLADAKAKGHTSVITFGAVGSNHVLATVIHAERLCIETYACLWPQPNAAYVRKNLLLDYAHGAHFVLTGSMYGAPVGFFRGMAEGARGRGAGHPYFIPPGGSNILGSLGYVDGALELKRQVDEGLVPEPDFIFVTYGSGSTAAGLLAGVTLAGMKSIVVPVRVVDKIVCNRYLLAGHVNRVADFVARRCPVSGIRGTRARDIMLIDDFCGPTYACFTPEGMAAVSRAKECDGIKLEGTYTGKTFAGALDFIRRHGLERRVCLFWNTYNSADLYPQVCDIDYHVLPEGVHKYFQDPLQEEEMSCEVVF
ncbi:MAG: pyridoxal-phosphate dependent enzyme [Actinomycetota bacterium]